MQLRTYAAGANCETVEITVEKKKKKCFLFDIIKTHNMLRRFCAAGIMNERIINMKRLWNGVAMGIVILIFAALFSSCGKNTWRVPNKSVFSEGAESVKASVLREYYEENFDPDTSERVIADFNGDGESEMVTVSIEKYENGALANFTIAYYRIKDGAMIRDWSVNDSAQKGFPAPQEAVVYSFTEGQQGIPQGGENLRIYMNEKGLICCVFFYRLTDSVVASYVLFGIQKEEVTAMKILWDPGDDEESSLYPYESYFYGDAAADVLYAGNSQNRKYDSYLNALQQEIGVRGFSFEALDQSGDASDLGIKGSVVENDSVKLLLSFRNY